MQNMSESSDHSISLWLSGLKRGEEEAARRVFERCFERLVQIAKSRLAGASRRVADEEDVALSVFHSLCRGAAAGRFERLRDRHELWQMLIAITQQKVVDLSSVTTFVKSAAAVKFAVSRCFWRTMPSNSDAGLKITPLRN